MLKDLWEDAKNIDNKDPACRHWMMVLLFYPGFHILINHRLAHWFYRHKLYFIASFISFFRKMVNWH